MLLLLTNFIFASNIPALYVRICTHVSRVLRLNSGYRHIAVSRRCRARASSIPSATVRSR